MRPLKWLVGGVLSILLLSLNYAHAVGDWRYSVRPGDDLWSIAAKCCGSAKIATRIATHNNILQHNHLSIGQRLNIPLAWLVKRPASAQVIAVSGGATYVTGGRVQINDEIQMGQRILSNEGYVLVQFADKSEMEIGPESDVMFNVMTVFEEAGMVDTGLRFYRGQARSRIEHQRQGSSYRISTPSGVAAVRGTRFRVVASQAKTLAETRNGSVNFADPKMNLDVPAGIGLIADVAGMVKEPLLAAPILHHPAESLFGGGEEIKWGEIAGAEGYRLNVYEPAAAGVPVFSARVAQPHFAVSRLADIPRGRYRFQVRGIAPSELEGLESELVYRLGHDAPLGLNILVEGSGKKLSWDTTAPAPYTLQLIGPDGTKNDHQLKTAYWSLPADIEPGQWRWQVKSDRSPFSESTAFAILPPPVVDLKIVQSQADLTLTWEYPKADSYQVQWAADPNFRRLIQDERVEARSFSFSPQRSGRYYARVSPIIDTVKGEFVQATAVIEGKKPWWLLGLMMLPLL